MRINVNVDLHVEKGENPEIGSCGDMNVDENFDEVVDGNVDVNIDLRVENGKMVVDVGLPEKFGNAGVLHSAVDNATITNIIIESLRMGRDAVDKGNEKSDEGVEKVVVPECEYDRNEKHDEGVEIDRVLEADDEGDH